MPFLALENVLDERTLGQLLSYAQHEQRRFRPVRVVHRGDVGGALVEGEALVLDNAEDARRALEQPLRQALLAPARQAGVDLTHARLADISLVALGDQQSYLNAAEGPSHEELRFALFFWRAPRAFAGGELRVRLTERTGSPLPERHGEPRRNGLLLLAAPLYLEISRVNNRSREFQDGLFVLFGRFKP
ncbi:hypothetical protein WA016_04184 [Myxococcus stipitatus]